MTRLPWLAAGLLALVLGSSSNGQDAKTTPVLIYVTLPADAKLAVDGVPGQTDRPGATPDTPPHQGRRNWQLHIDGYVRSTERRSRCRRSSPSRAAK